MINKHNLVSLKDRPKEERQEIARLGGVKSGEVRRDKARFRRALNSYMVQEDFKRTIQGYHFRNGKITDKQVQETRSYLKSLYHLKMRELKVNHASEEIIQETREAYKLLRGSTKTFLKEIAREKEEIKQTIKNQDKQFNKLVRQTIKRRY